MGMLTAVFGQCKVAAVADMLGGLQPAHAPPSLAWQLKFGFLLETATSSLRLATKVHPGKASPFKHIEKTRYQPSKRMALIKFAGRRHVAGAAALGVSAPQPRAHLRGHRRRHRSCRHREAAQEEAGRVLR